ncbi:MAG: Fe-S biogenesis protein NfuA [Endozoicomonadaceae bacterium]|nr:Fe-S biogenesis protein NfuA [Endozoicomonadaceae bacterium]
MNIEITPEAQQYLEKLLLQQKVEGIAVRLFVSDPGTPHAETCLAYCRPGEEKPGDQPLQTFNFPVWIDAASLPYLEESTVDFTKDKLGGQLTIKAPNAKLPQLDENSSLTDKINYYLTTEINPNLASHGGMVTLHSIDDDYAVLQFGGGCQGCGMVDTTLQDGIETTLKRYIPELKGVKDITDHSMKDNAYY